MIEPKSTATIRALASLAEISANQLEDGVDIEEVIATLRKAAEAVRHVVDAEDLTEDDDFEDQEDLAQDLTPMKLAFSADDGEKADQSGSDVEEEPVLNAG